MKTIADVARVSNSIEYQVVELLVVGVAFVTVPVDFVTVSLAIDTKFDRINSRGVGGVRRLDIEADIVVVWRLGEHVLRQSIGDWHTLVVAGGRLLGGDSRDGHKEEESCNCSREHGEWQQSEADNWFVEVEEKMWMGMDVEEWLGCWY